MQKMLRVFSSLLIISILLFPITTSAAGTKSLKLGKLFKDKETGFQIKLPKGWKKTPDVSAYRVQAVDPKTGTNINVTFAIAEKDFATELQDIKAALPQIIPGYQLVDDLSFKIKGGDAHVIGGIFVVDDTDVQNFQLLAMKDNHFYTVTATAAKADWNRYSKFFLKVFKTFRLIPAKGLEEF